MDKIATHAGQIVPFSAEKANAASSSGATQRHDGVTSKARISKDSQRALDKAHNDAVLAGSSGGPQDLTLQLALQEPKVRQETASHV